VRITPSGSSAFRSSRAARESSNGTASDELEAV
jgi:hypothetical protein